MTNIKATQESGRSMVEMLGVLAIIGVLSVGGIAGYSQAMGKFKITKTIDQIQTLTTNIRTLYASQRKYSGITAANMYKAGILTDESYDATNSKGLNPYGGEIVLANDSTGRTFSINYTGLTGEACLKLATAEWGADASSGLVGIVIGTNNHTVWGGSDDTKSLPITTTGALSQCGAATANNSSVTWHYR